MALIGTLRNKAGKIVVGAIMLTMVAFIGTDLIGNSTLLGGGSDPDIAEIGGKTVSNKVFQSKVDELSYYFSLNAGRNPLQQELEQIRNQAWNALILENTYEPQFEELGIGVTDAELVDLVQGNNIAPQIQQFFTDPNTGQFSKENVTTFLANISQAPPQQQNSWIAFERSLQPSRKVEKYAKLFEKSNYVNKYEAKEQYVNQTADINIDYLYVPFLSINDTLVFVTDSELEAYINENKNEYQTEESRSLKYVTFDIIPSSYDSALVEDEVNQLVVDFKEAVNDSTFSSINSDDQFTFLSFKEDNLPDSLKSRPIGYVTSPVIINGAYEFSKLSRVDFENTDSTSFKVAKIRKEFFVSDETINEVYRTADMFAATANDMESFESLAGEQGIKVLNGNKIDKNASRVGILNEARSLVIWLYNEGEVDKVSDVKEIKDKYVVAVMTSEQDAGVADINDVRNQVERQVKNEKKAKIITSKLNAIEADDLEGFASSYGDGAKTGSANFKVSSNNVAGIGYAPEIVGISNVLEEGELTRAFKLRDGIVIINLDSKEIPEEIEDYTSYISTIESQRVGAQTIIADFPLSFFRIVMNRGIDESLKDEADIEDMRYKFF